MNHGAIETFSLSPLAARLYIYGQLPALSLFRRPRVACGWQGTSQWLGFDEPKLPLISHFFLVTISRKFLMGIFLPLSNFPLLKGLKLATKLPSNSKFISALLVVTELFLSLPSFHDLLNLTKSFYLRHKALFSAFIISSLSPGSNKSRSIWVLECDMTLTQRHNFLKSAAPASVGWQWHSRRWKCAENGKLKITLPVNSANNSRSQCFNAKCIILEMLKTVFVICPTWKQRLMGTVRVHC